MRARRGTHWFFEDEPPSWMLERTMVHITEFHEVLQLHESGVPRRDELNEFVYEQERKVTSFPLLDVRDGWWTLPRASFTAEELMEEGFEVEQEETEYAKLPRHLSSAADLIELRDEVQQRAFDAVMRNEGGFLVLAPGKGKTILGLKSMCAWGERTLILFENGGLMEQWAEEIQQWLEPRTGEVGRLQGPYDRWDWEKPIVLGMLKSLTMHAHRAPPEFFRAFGTVIWDEAHHLAARTYMPSADMFTGRRLALTATPERDGWEHYLYAHIGQPVIVDLRQDLVPSAFFWGVEVPGVRNYDKGSMRAYVRLVSDCLGTNETPNRTGDPHPRYLRALVERLEDAQMRGRKVLLICQRKDLPYLLSEQLEEGLNIIDGSVRFSERTALLRSHDIVSVTPRVGAEGLNRVDLDYVLVAFPLGSQALNAMRQTIGRALRIYPNGNKPKPEAHFLFPLTEYGRKLARANQELCEELGYEIAMPSFTARPRPPKRQQQPAGAPRPTLAANRRTPNYGGRR